MKIFNLVSIIAICFNTSSVLGQNVHGFNFQDYATKVVNTKKAKLNYSSNKLGSSFKTEISRQYSIGKVDFGGHYITVLWGSGMGLTMGAMVDVNTGNIYELPLNSNNSYREAFYNDEDNYLYKPYSNLFTCYVCKINKKDDTKVDLLYHFYKWDDITKKFILLKTKNITTKQISEY